MLQALLHITYQGGFIAFNILLPFAINIIVNGVYMVINSIYNFVLLIG